MRCEEARTPWAARLSPGRATAPSMAIIVSVPTSGVSRDAGPGIPSSQLPERSGPEHRVRPGWTSRPSEYRPQLVVSCLSEQHQCNQRRRPGLLPGDAKQAMDGAVARLIQQQERNPHVGHKQHRAADIPHRSQSGPGWSRRDRSIDACASSTMFGSLSGASPPRRKMAFLLRHLRSSVCSETDTGDPAGHRDKPATDSVIASERRDSSASRDCTMLGYGPSLPLPRPMQGRHGRVCASVRIGRCRLLR